jgi:hypothetical protein
VVSRRGKTARPYEKIISKMSRARAFGFVRDVARTGNRWLGGRGESAARAYVVRKFKEFGLKDVHTESFEYLNYRPKDCSLSVTNPKRLEIECRPLQYSKLGEAEGEVVYAGTGTEAEFKALEKEIRIDWLQSE